MRLLSIMLVLVGLLTLSACGNKGPLYLPDDNKTPEKANKAAIPTAFLAELLPIRVKQ